MPEPMNITFYNLLHGFIEIDHPFTSYLTHYTIPSLPVACLQALKLRIEKEEAEKKTGQSLLDPSSCSRTLPGEVRSQTSVKGLLGIRKKAQKKFRF